MLHILAPFQAAKHTNGRGEEQANSWTGTRPNWLDKIQRRANDARIDSRYIAHRSAKRGKIGNQIGAAVVARLRE